MMAFPEPTDLKADRAEVLLGYIDYFRSVVATRIEELDERTLRTSRLPTGWSPLELLKHLVAMEQRWLVWGFAGEDVDNPWFDHRDERWFLDESDTAEGLLHRLHAGGQRTRQITLTHSLDDVGAPGPRWDDGATPATLERVLLHVMQEYARHSGHLDIVCELADSV